MSDRLTEYERVLWFSDEATNLKGIIAIHSTILGPALGGTRMFPYRNEWEALRDVLRLAKTMTYKAAAAGLNLGGGKAVIIGDPITDKSVTLLQAYARIVDSLTGHFITAEDVGISVADLDIIKAKTGFVTGCSPAKGGSGDSAPATALGVFQGMKAVLEEMRATDDFRGKTIAIQGLGKVGYALAERLHQAGANLIVSDINPFALEKAKKEFGDCVTVVEPEKIHAVEADIFAPCACGDVINRQTIPEIQTKIIAGCANNQLEDEDPNSWQLHQRGIVYVPDFIINAGGIINLAAELDPKGYQEPVARQRIIRICDRVKEIIRKSQRIRRPPLEIAKGMACEHTEKRKTPPPGYPYSIPG